MDKINKMLRDSIEEQLTLVNDDSLYRGKAGYLLYLFQLNKACPDYVDKSLFQHHFDQIQDNLPRYLNNLSMAGGLIGVAWFIEFLNQQQGDDYCEELCQSIDQIVIQHLKVKSWQGQLDITSGLSGVAIYAARRQQKSDQRLIFTELVRHLEANAIYFEDGTLSWPEKLSTPPDLKKGLHKKIDVYDLGLAHGVPGIINALLAALKITALKEQVTRLLIKSCNWLIKQKLTDNEDGVYFSTFSTRTEPSRLAWCYGDLSNALTLAKVGKALSIPEYSNLAKSIAMQASSRDEIAAGVVDTGICHGSAGLALIFKLLYRELKLESLEHASSSWRNFTLTRFEQQKLGGLYSYNGLTNKYEETKGFLEGYAGIGLTLLALENQDYDWTDSLMLA